MLLIFIVHYSTESDILFVCFWDWGGPYLYVYSSLISFMSTESLRRFPSDFDLPRQIPWRSPRALPAQIERLYRDLRLRAVGKPRGGRLLPGAVT